MKIFVKLMKYVKKKLFICVSLKIQEINLVKCHNKHLPVIEHKRRNVGALPEY